MYIIFQWNKSQSIIDASKSFQLEFVLKIVVLKEKKSVEYIKLFQYRKEKFKGFARNKVCVFPNCCWNLNVIIIELGKRKTQNRFIINPKKCVYEKFLIKLLLPYFHVFFSWIKINQNHFLKLDG